MSPADERMRQTVLCARLYREMGRLAPRSRAMINMFYGGLTYSEIGRTAKLSASRISQICAKGIRRMRHAMVFSEEHEGER